MAFNLKQNFNFLLTVTFLLLVMIGVARAQADELAETKKKLDSISSEIQSLTNKDLDLGKTIGRIERKLLESDKNLNALGKQARSLNRQLEASRNTIRDLQSNQKKLLSQRGELQKSFVKNARAQQRILLSSPSALQDQSGAAQNQRLAYWLKHLNNRHQRTLDELARVEIELKNVESKRLAEAGSVEKLKRSIDKQKLVIEKNRNEQARLARSAEQERKKNARARESLEKDVGRLNALMEKLQIVKAYPDFADNGKTPFSKLKGRLPWPVSGAVMKSRFNAGVTIEATPGTRVRAISHGRIVFADWMKGFGQLVIIDHGEGYMTLYGQNETIYSEAGERVEAGTVIGLSGQSGGQPYPGVYFEIRKNTQGLNPLMWCVAKAGGK